MTKQIKTGDLVKVKISAPQSVNHGLCMHFRTKEMSDFFGKKFLSLHKKAYKS